MGPRLFSRGNAVGMWGPPIASWCFNGAATLQSRKFRIFTLTRLRQKASMGPRLFSRGNYKLCEAVLAAREQLSMGPRLFSRGNKWNLLEVDLVIEASMGPRLFSRGNRAGDLHRIPAQLALQWGRDSSVAEIVLLTPPALEDTALQWGRDSSVAEIRCRSDGDRRGGLLQWGRDSSVAEITCPRRMKGNQMRFNGAATLQSRKLIIIDDPDTEQTVLQWGRDSSVAEITIEGGITITVLSFNGAATLQSRKSRAEDRSSLSADRFNGAATLQSRKLRVWLQGRQCLLVL